MCTIELQTNYLNDEMFLAHFFFFFNDTATTEIYTLSLHDALPICACAIASDVPRANMLRAVMQVAARQGRAGCMIPAVRSEEHTSELQSPCNLVCRLLLEKKNTQIFTCSSYTSRILCTTSARHRSY